jgi:release factor glutamine methyltransferase
VTVLEVIQRSTEFLVKKGVDSPRLQVELLLAHVLKLPRLKLYLNFERKLAEAELETVREMVKRRGNREPLQHVLGSVSFCGLEIKVNRHVLVPRPETELLAERAWQFLTVRNTRPLSVLDLGTGSGCLAIAMAVHCPTAQIEALDISATALALARENAAANGVAERIRFHSGDGFAALPTAPAFDLIVSNPPYIPSAEIETLAPEVRDHDPRVALDGGADGLNFHRRLTAEAASHLRPEGRIMLEFGDGQAERIRQLFVQHNWIVESVEADYSGRPRFLTARAERA